MPEYRVELETYCGPLDLLLYLVKRDEIDLNDIPISRLTDQYLRWLEGLQRIDINVAGEFLVMAATLLEIKSKMIVPESVDEDESEADQGDAGLSPRDPRYELVQQLLEYRRIKQVSRALEQRLADWERRFANRPAAHPLERRDTESDEDAPVPIDLDEVNLFDLCEAFSRILATIGDRPRGHEVIDDDTPIALYQEDLLDQIQRDQSISFHRTMEGRSRMDMVGLFIAMLELVRNRKVRLEVEGSDIRLFLRPEADQVIPEQSAEDRWKDPETGRIEYEWPSEQERLRAERRAKLRETYARKKAMGEAIDEDADAGPDEESLEAEESEPDDLDDPEREQS